MTDTLKNKTTLTAAEAAAKRAAGVEERSITGNTAVKIGETTVNPNWGTITYQMPKAGATAGAATPTPSTPTSQQSNASRVTRPSRRTTNPNGGTTTISGNPKIVMNGETVNGTGADIGDLSNVTAGLENIRNMYKSSANPNKPEITLNEDNGNIIFDSKDSGLRADRYTDGADEQTVAWDRAKASGDSLSQVSTYAGLSDLGDIVKWSDNRVTIGGIDVPYAYIDKDGRAYASKSAIDNAIAQVRADTGIKNPTKLTEEVMSRYSKSVDTALDKVVNRDKWSYNPENDPAYQAYAKQYSRNAEQLYNRAMGSGGLYSAPNSYQMYQALAAYGDNMQKLSDTVPQLAQQDYGRYSDEQTRNRAALEALQNERKINLDAETAANDSMYNRYRAADELNYSRRQDARFGDKKQSGELEKLAQELSIGNNSVAQSNEYTERYPTMLDLQLAAQRGELTAQDLANAMSRMENAVYKANMNEGIFDKNDMDILGIPQDMEKYPNSNGYSPVHLAEIKRLVDIWNNVDKVKAMFSMGM